MSGQCASMVARRALTPATHPAAAPPRRANIGASNQVLLQREAVVGAVNDPLERQADAAADAVLAGRRLPGFTSAAPSPQRRCEDCEHEDATLQRKDIGSTSAGHAGPSVMAGAEAAAAAVSGGGRPLSASERAYFEPRFARDFSAVRIHEGARAGAAARSIHAHAYTLGHDIAFAPAQYAPGSSGGKRLLAHELAHVVQQRRKTTVIYRKEPEKKTAEEKETELGQTLRGPAYSAGYALAFYDQNEPEARRRAEDFAAREPALSFTGSKPTPHSVITGKPISGVFDVDKTTIAISDVVSSALSRVPAQAPHPPESAEAPRKIKTLAIFAHGTSDWCSLGVTVSNAVTIFKAIASRLANNVTIVLYTCSSARGSDEPEDWIKGTMQGGGEGSLAALVRDTLAEEKIDAATVWGHTTVGHVSRNFALRAFNARAGKGAKGDSYVSSYVFTDSELKAATTDLVEELNRLGYTVNATDESFVAAASSALGTKFYEAYAVANRKLEGTNVAEEAPLHPYMTASRITAYWDSTFWPAEKERTATALAKKLKLKKTGAKQ